MPGDPGATVVTNACAFYHCARGCGCIGHPAFPAPFLGSRRSLLGVAPRPSFRGGSSMHNSGALRGEKIEVRHIVIASEAKQSILSSRYMDCFVASLLAMTIYFLSSPAKAGDPVFRGVSGRTEELRRTGYCAGACHRARRRRDPVAEYDVPLWSTAQTCLWPILRRRYSALLTSLIRGSAAPIRLR